MSMSPASPSARPRFGWWGWCVLLLVILSTSFNTLEGVSPSVYQLVMQSINVVVCSAAVVWLVTAALMARGRVRPGPWAGNSPAVNVALAVATLAFALPPLLTGRLLGEASPAWQHALVWVSTAGFIAAAVFQVRLRRSRSRPGVPS